MSKAYDFLFRGLFGNQSIEQQQRKQRIRAQRVIDDRARKSAQHQNTADEKKAIEYFHPGTSNLKCAQHISSESLRNKRKCHTGISSSDEEMGDAAEGKEQDKGKCRKNVLEPDSDENAGMGSDSSSAESPCYLSFCSSFPFILAKLHMIDRLSYTR